MQIYDKQGYLNVPEIRKIPHTFLFLFAARGTGKTFPVSLQLLEEGKPFIYMRRTESELFECGNDELSPFNEINYEYNFDVHFEKIRGAKHTMSIKDGQNSVGVGLALSTIHNIRGFNALDKAVLFYDECVPQINVRQMKGEDMAILHAYETCNRNRELNGYAPLEFILAGNSDNLDAAIFSAFKLYPYIESMKRSGEDIVVDNEKGIIVVYAQHSPISEQKADTALYKATNNTDFKNVALHNIFAQETYFEFIKKVPLNEYKQMCATPRFRIFSHKSQKIVYVSEPKGTQYDFLLDMKDVQKFYARYLYLTGMFERGKVYFENYNVLHFFREIFY